MKKIKTQNIIEKALMFATIAHAGQVRKGEPNIPYIMHPIAVAQILNENGADEKVIAAGLLHDVVEDTDYTVEDIRKKFGDYIAHLVDIATEKDKSKPWEERKLAKIMLIEQLDSDEKKLIAADKINNIEGINRIFEKKGFRDFSAFSRGEEKQEWYYRNIYKNLIKNEDKENSLYKRLETGINNVFGRNMDEYDKSISSEER